MTAGCISDSAALSLAQGGLEGRELAEALRLEERAVEFFEERGARRMEGFTRIYLARIAHREGDAARAEEQARRAAAVLDRVGCVGEGEAPSRLALAEALDAAGRRDEAREQIDRARRRLDERASAWSA